MLDFLSGGRPVNLRCPVACCGEYVTEDIYALTIHCHHDEFIVCLADHGSRLPGNIKFNSLEKFHIPMLWIGGALKIQDSIISVYGSQIDIANTILSQLNISNNKYKYGKDLLDTNIKDFSFFVFNDGLGYIDKDCYYIYDNIAGQIIENSASFQESDLEFGQALLQKTMNDFLK